MIANVEPRPTTLSTAILAAHKVDETLGDGHAQARALGLVGIAGAIALEGQKDSIEEFRRHAAAGVAYRHPVGAETAGRVGKLGERHGDESPSGRELHRIAHGVHEDLVQAQGISDHLRMGQAVHVDGQIDADGLRLLVEHVLHLDHGIRQA